MSALRCRHSPEGRLIAHNSDATFLDWEGHEDNAARLALLHIGRSSQGQGQSPSLGRPRKSCSRLSISAQRRGTWLLLTRYSPITWIKIAPSPEPRNSQLKCQGPDLPVPLARGTRSAAPADPGRAHEEPPR